jgi:hypothetical protein
MNPIYDKKSGLWGYMDTRNNWAIAPHMSALTPLARISWSKKEWRWGFNIPTIKWLSNPNLN